MPLLGFSCYNFHLVLEGYVLRSNYSFLEGYIFESKDFKEAESSLGLSTDGIRCWFSKYLSECKSPDPHTQALDGEQEGLSSKFHL